MALSAATLSTLAFVVSFLNQCPLYDRSKYETACKLDGSKKFDFIIVGGGSAGSTLAARLTEKSNWNVLLIEAGGAPTHLSEAPAVFLALQGTEEDYQFKTERDGKTCLGFENQRCNWPQGKALGGGSTINAMLAINGLKRDYEEWAGLGNTQWNWENMKKYFDKTFDKMNTSSYESIMPTRTFVLEAAKSLGYPINTPDLTVGYQDVKLAINANQRNNVAKAYLVPANQRKNLCVITKATVTRILFKRDTPNGPEAIGVILSNGKMYYAQKEVIIAAGAVNTPKLLMLSGIGPRSHLKSHGIPIVKELPGVGQNLQDHMMFPGYLVKFPLMPIEADLGPFLNMYCENREGPLGQIDIGEFVGWINTKDTSMTADPNVQFMHMTMLKNDSFLTPSYVQKMGFNEASLDSIMDESAKNTILTIIAILSKPKSRGQILLASSDPKAAPLIYSGYLTDKDDMTTMLGAIEHMASLIGTPAFAGSELVNFRIPNCDSLAFRSEEFWKCSLRNFGTTLYHPVGTCKMGVQSDPMSVVNQELKVHGVGNLRIVDASIMPTIVTGNTNMPVIAVAERIADVIKSSTKY